jgi:lysozyme family protein
MATSDDDIIELILLHEGGKYTDDPADAGGPTRWGITIPVLSAYRGYVVSYVDIQALTRKEAADIYRQRFVRPFDGVSESVRVNAVDFGVNAGVRRAVLELQKTIGATVDGKLGPQTKTLSMERDWNALYTGARLSFYEGLILARPTDIKWRNGWRRRALSFLDPLTRRSRGILRRRVGQDPLYGQQGKAILEPLDEAA